VSETARAFAGATGRGVRLAVIDSGAAARHPHLGPIADGVSVDESGVFHAGLEHATDQIGHGTAVMAAIQEKAPDAEYIAVKIFHDRLRTRADTLLRSIGWCIDHGVMVANLSLGTVNTAHRGAFEAMASLADEAGCLLVSAREANGEPCYPGALPTVFGVDVDWDCPREAYRCTTTAGDNPTFRASGYPRPVPGVPPARNLHGISFAVANMSGFVARALELAGPVDDPRARSQRVREVLMAHCSLP
jgi:subtilisin family serine protease